MSDGMLVYLLSVMEGVHGAAIMVAGLGGMFCILCVMDVSTSVTKELTRSEARSLAALKRSVPIVLCAVAIAALMPSQDALIKSYLMVEGSKVATADNAQKAVDGAMKRIDALIERLGK